SASSLRLSVSPRRSSSTVLKSRRTLALPRVTSRMWTCCRCKGSMSTTSCVTTRSCSARPPWTRLRSASNEQGCAPLRRDQVAGHHREGDSRVRAEQGCLPRRQGCNEAADQGSGGEAVRREGNGRKYVCHEGQGKALQGPARPEE